MPSGQMPWSCSNIEQSKRRICPFADRLTSRWEFVHEPAQCQLEQPEKVRNPVRLFGPPNPPEFIH
jgi:hypothetical protein